MTRILGVPIHFVTYEKVHETIEAWRRQDTGHYVCLSNPHTIMLCRRDAAMRGATQGADLVLPDGTGTVLAAAVLRYPNPGRVPGPTLLLRLCDDGRVSGYRHFFYGGAPGVPEQLALRLLDRFPGLNIVGTYSPPFRPLSDEEDRGIVSRINETRPDIVWVGIGAPKQEKWMAAHRGRIAAPVMIGVGAAFDFHSGNVAWAPAWVRRMGCEWAYRLWCEPKRMWRRNVDGVVYVGLVLAQCWRQLLSRRLLRTAWLIARRRRANSRA